MELVNGTFYQASCDGASVAIIADYPGLLHASRVSKAKKIYPLKRNPFLCHALCLKYRIFVETTVGTRRRAPGGSSAKGLQIGQVEEEGD